MKSFFSIGSKQTDLEIFKYVDDRDILSLCLVNKSANKILNDDTYWLQRFFYFYQKYLKKVNYKEYKTGKSWKQYYIDITKRLKDPFPYYASAIAFTERRFDVLTLLENFHNIKRVKPIMRRKGNTIECYYVRTDKDRDKEDRDKEGPYFKVDLPYYDNKSSLNYMIVSKFPNRLEENYISGVIQSAREFFNSVMISERIYEDDDLVKETIWNKKGAKIREEIYQDEKSVVKEWYVNGSIKSESVYKRGKKHGISYRWKKNGEKSIKYYFMGIITESPEETQARIVELKRQAQLERLKGSRRKL